MRIEYSKSAVKALQRIDKHQRLAIRDAIQGLTLIPPKGDIKPLQGYKDGRMRLRVGSYRVIYRYGNDGQMIVLYIIEIGSRGDIYK
ncbi:MAG: type II toxin-antitoxin system RelE/ParE family toxin [Clostridia bacterium]|nr:type II toxin-antitoxin system RelE/ParE family toxin [Clostridia bacterium]